VSVAREAAHPAFSERQWIIDLPDQTRGSIPFSWAVPVDAPGENVQTHAEQSTDLRADVATLLNLAKMVHRLMESQPEEVESDETTICHSLARKGNPPAACSLDVVSSVGASASGMPTRTGNDVSIDAAETNPDPLPNSSEGRR
jgi:hypothetical protein